MRLAAAAVLMTLALAACDEASDDDTDMSEAAGEAVEDAGDSVENAADDLESETDEVAQ